MQATFWYRAIHSDVEANRVQSILAGMVGVSFIVPLNIYGNRR